MSDRCVDESVAAEALIRRLATGAYEALVKIGEASEKGTRERLEETKERIERKRKALRELKERQWKRQNLNDQLLLCGPNDPWCAGGETSHCDPNDPLCGL